MSICARVEPPRGGGTLSKRKERERSSSSVSEQPQRAPPSLFPAVSAKPQPPRPAAHPARFVKPMPPPPFPKGGGSTFKLMAGYLAHEFLRSGTLLGDRPESSSNGPAAASAGTAPAPDPRTRYAEASLLLMTGGARVPGVVNPTQLGQWLRIKE